MRPPTHCTTPSPRGFATATCTVVGREHARLGRANQDGVAARHDARGLVLVVTDGCSTGRGSELGARFGAAYLAHATLARLAATQDAGALAGAVTDALAGELGRLAASLGADDDAGVVVDHLLFSFLVAAATEDVAMVFGVGDGVYAIDDDRSVIDPGPDNAPPYLAYRLLGRSVAPVVHWVGRPTAIGALWVASDGAVDVTEDVARVAVDRNPSLLQKRLNVLARAPGLFDDTSIALARRTAEGLAC